MHADKSNGAIPEDTANDAVTHNNAHGYYKPKSWSKTLLLIFVILFCITVALYILKLNLLLPKEVSRFLSKALFWPTVPVTILERAGRYISRVDDTVIIGAAPYGFLNIPELLYDTYNVRAVINLCEEFEGPSRKYEKLGIKQLNLPTPDHFEPSVEQMESAMSFIDQYRAQGQKVYVHCKAGHGRSAALVFAWLLYRNPKVNRKELNEQLCKIRKVRPTLWMQENIIEFHSRLGHSEIERSAPPLKSVSNGTAVAVLYWSAQLLLTIFFSGTVLFILNHRHILPKPIARVASKVLFWPTMPLTFAKRFGRYISTVDDTLIMGGVPIGFLNIPELLVEPPYNISAVINMCDEFQGPEEKYKKLGITQLRLPTVDHYEPSTENLERAVSFIAQYKSQGKKVYVHCKAGHGRAGAVAFSWLLYKNPEAKRKELNDELRKIRRVRKTLWRQQNIKEFHSRIKHGEINTGQCIDHNKND